MQLPDPFAQVQAADNAGVFRRLREWRACKFAGTFPRRVSKIERTGVLLLYYDSGMSSETLSRKVRSELRRRYGDRGRYPVATEVAYQVTGDGRTFTMERARSVNISSSGILLETETALSVGVPIVLQIAWPVKLNQLVALTLHVRGRTLRSTGNHTAVAIKGYQFRTRRQTRAAANAGLFLVK